MEFIPNIKIETDRLILRYICLDDKKAIFENINHDKDVLKYFVDVYNNNIEESRLPKLIDLYMESKRYFFAIVLKGTNEVIGLMLQCNNDSIRFNTIEVGYAIGKKYWNKGYTTEALKAFINFLFSLGIHKVTASYFLENVASKKVMEKSGMIYEGIKKDEIYYHDKYNDLAYYYIINPNDK